MGPSNNNNNRSPSAAAPSGAAANAARATKASGSDEEVRAQAERQAAVLVRHSTVVHFKRPNGPVTRAHTAHS